MKRLHRGIVIGCGVVSVGGIVLGLIGVSLWRNSVPSQSPGDDLYGFRPFRETDPWNTVVDQAPLDRDSDEILATIGLDLSLHPDFGSSYHLRPHGIPYRVVRSQQKRVPVHLDIGDPGPYPIPSDAPIEGGAKSKGDRHVIVVDRDEHKLYELYSAHPKPDGSWEAASGAVFDLKNNLNVSGLRKGWGSADAAGLPIFPGLVRFDEVSTGEIPHALRFTLVKTRRAFVPPANHFASSITDRQFPPMGMRVRLKSSVPIDDLPPQAKVIARALKKHGMILADNGGNWFVSGTPDRRWDDKDLSSLQRLKGRDFEVVKLGWTGDTWREDQVKRVRQFYTDLGRRLAGQPVLTEAFDPLVLMQENDAFRTVLEGMRVEIRAGKSLSEAMTKYPDWFDVNVVATVHQAELFKGTSRILIKLGEESG